jgi:hypothetical protein
MTWLLMNKLLWFVLQLWVASCYQCWMSINFWTYQLVLALGLLNIFYKFGILFKFLKNNSYKLGIQIRVQGWFWLLCDYYIHVIETNIAIILNWHFIESLQGIYDMKLILLQVILIWLFFYTKITSSSYSKVLAWYIPNIGCYQCWSCMAFYKYEKVPDRYLKFVLMLGRDFKYSKSTILILIWYQ